MTEGRRESSDVENISIWNQNMPPYPGPRGSNRKHYLLFLLGGCLGMGAQRTGSPALAQPVGHSTAMELALPTGVGR